MTEAERRKQRPTAQARPFGLAPEAPPSPIVAKPPPMPDERPAREANQRAHERAMREADNTYRKTYGPLPTDVDPNASIKEQHRQWQAERRAEQRACEDASQPYKPAPAKPVDHRAAQPSVQKNPPPPAPSAPQPPPPSHTATRPAPQTAAPAGQEITERPAQQMGNQAQAETTDCRQEVTDKEAQRAAMMAGMRRSYAREKENERER